MQVKIFPFYILALFYKLKMMAMKRSKEMGNAYDKVPNYKRYNVGLVLWHNKLLPLVPDPIGHWFMSWMLPL